MKDFIEAKLRQGQFSTPSEYIRSLIRDDQDLNGNREMALLVRRGIMPVSNPAHTARLTADHEPPEGEPK